MAVWNILLLLSSGAHAAAAAPPAFSTFLKENATLQAIGHDSAGNIYVAGNVNDSPIPGHGADFFVARLDASATRIAYFVYLGGSGSDVVIALAVDGDGNTYVTGETSSTDFPSASQVLPAGSAGKAFPFVVKLDATGRAVFSVLIENQASAFPRALALDGAGNAIITGYSNTSGFPVTPGAYSTGDSKNQPFVLKLDLTALKPVFSVVGVGGSQVAIGPQGDVFLAGSFSTIFGGMYPTTPGAFQTTFQPSYDCSFPCQIVFPSPEQYVTRLSADGTKLVYSTFVTGSHGALNLGLAIDGAGNAYVTGSTSSTDYPLTVAQAAGSRPGMFLTRLDPGGSKVTWSVQQGGSLLALDASGNLVAGGFFQPPGGIVFQAGQYPPFPPTGDTPAACLPDGYIVQYNSYVQRFRAEDGVLMGTEILSASRLMAEAIDVAPDGRVLLGGDSDFSDVPLTPGTVFSAAVAQRTAPSAFLAGFDLASAAIGGQLACVADGLTSQPVGPVTPGQLITLYGNGLGPAGGIASSIGGPGPAATSLGGVSVKFDDVPAPLAYVSARQINAGVPFEVASRSR